MQIHARFGAELPTMKSTMHLYPIDGAAHDLAPDGHSLELPRRASGDPSSPVWTPTPPTSDLIRRWSIDYFEALHPYSAGGAYVNMMMDEGQERVREPATATTTKRWPASRRPTIPRTSSAWSPTSSRPDPDAVGRAAASCAAARTQSMYGKGRAGCGLLVKAFTERPECQPRSVSHGWPTAGFLDWPAPMHLLSSGNSRLGSLQAFGFRRLEATCM